VNGFEAIKCQNRLFLKKIFKCCKIDPFSVKMLQEFNRTAIKPDKIEIRLPFHIRMTTANHHRPYAGPSGTEAFTVMELLIAIGIIGVLAVIALSFLSTTKKTAYEIIAKHDLQNFVKAEEAYYIENSRYIGDKDDSIRNDGVSSDFVLEGFRPSEGVCITIASGDPEDPDNPDDPYIAQSKHKKASAVFEYNFHTKVMTRR